MATRIEAHAPAVTGAPITSALHLRFTWDMHNAGFTVNWLTRLDGTETPSVYGMRCSILQATEMPLGFRTMGDYTIAWPI
jgi:hypothetical protein